MASKLLNSHPVVLSDGRKVRVLEYEDGSVRVRLAFVKDRPGYLLEEAYLQGGRNDFAITKLTPKG